MANLLPDSQCVYVEPNMIGGVTAYEDELGNTASRSTSLEDLCIVVDLEVEIKGRSYSGRRNEDDTITLEWQSSNDGQVVNFMKGSKIYTDKERKKYVNALTTRYTDIFLKDIENEGNAEMFGIRSIDISYTNFMVPEVTIQFVDVRGVSLFAQEEMRHNLVSDGVTATANPDIEGSFFKCFFTFPYPKFTLKVKGFYGNMVSYELTCSDFRAAFDSSTGNFNVTAKFIGYSFSFLNDVMVNALLAAPYSPYVGLDYWERNLGTRFRVRGKNGTDEPMVRLGEICRQYNDIMERVDKELSEEGGLMRVAERQNLTQEQMNKLRTSDITPLKKEYISLTDQMRRAAESSRRQPYDVVISTDSSNSFCLITDYDHEEIMKFNDNLRSLRDKLLNSDSQPLKDWATKNELKISKYDDWADSDPIKGLTYKGKVHSENVDYVKEYALVMAIHAKANEKCPEEKDKYYHVLWEDGDDSTCYVYQDFGLRGLLGEYSQTEADTASEAEVIREEVRNRQLRDEFANAFNFMPTIGNISKILMAHLETYVNMISTCAEDITQAGTSRSASNLGVSLLNFPDAKGNNSTARDENVMIPPFPLVTKTVMQEGTEKMEDTWIGEFGTMEEFEEIALIDGLLDGITSASTDVNFAARGMTQGEVELNAKCVMRNPLSMVDLFMGEGDKPFGSEVNLRDANDLFTRFCLRAFSTMAVQETGDNSLVTDPEAFGKLDAESFLDMYGQSQDITYLQDTLRNGSLTKEMLLDFFEKRGTGPGGTTIPWKQNSPLLSKIGNGNLFLNCGAYNMFHLQRAIPVKNYTLGKWADEIDSFRESNIAATDLTPYVLTNTPYQNNAYLDDKDANIIYIEEKKVRWVQNSLSTLRGSGNYSGKLDKIFGSAKFDADVFKNPMQSLTFNVFEDGISQESLELKDAVTYNDYGLVSNGRSLSYDFCNIFFSSNYYASDSLYDKASIFIEGGFKTGNVAGNLYTSALSLGQLKLDSPCMTYMGKVVVLQLGCKLKEDAEYMKDMRCGIRDKFIKYYDDWVEKEFRKIDEAFALKFKYAITPRAKSDACRSMTGETNKPHTSRERQDVVGRYVNDMTEFLRTYNINDDENNAFTAKPTNEMASVIEDLFQAVTVCLPTKFNSAESGAYQIYVKESALGAYFESLVNTMRDMLGVQVNDQRDDSGFAMTTISMNSDDIRVGVYNYVKMLYDKWVSSGNTLRDYTMEKMFYDSDHTFHFIDSMYNPIGDTMFINISTLVEEIVRCQTQNGYTLLSLMSELYSSNKFQFLCIQNFDDLSKKENMVNMFRPVPYIDIVRPDNHPDFVVLYPYEASSRLDVHGADFPDDTFYLNEASTCPTLITSKPEGSRAIPAFGVTYGQQYQNYFSNIQVDMNSPMTTEQSIKAKFLVSGAGIGTENNGTRSVAVGQDLYTIYSNNSYTCTVTMMGCAWVQPMMYFVLQNVPMFRGSYMICKVNHQIESGKMTTVFTGVRMSKNATRTVKDPFYGEDMFSTSGYVDETEQFEHSNAGAGNDCEWAYNDPTPRLYSSTNFSADLSAKLVDNIDSNGLQRVVDFDGGYFMDFTILDTLAAIAYTEFDGETEAALTNRAAVLACMYNRRGIVGSMKAYKTMIFQTNGWFYFHTDNVDYRVRLKATAEDNQKMTRGRKLVLDIFSHGPYDYLVGKKNMWTDSTITREQVQRGLCTPGFSDSREIREKLMAYGPAQYEPEHYGKYFHVIVGLREYPDGYVPEPSGDEKTELTDEDYYSGFTRAVEASLRANSAYRETTVGMTVSDDGWLMLEASGSNANNAMFDCLLQTYDKYFDNIQWVCGTGSVSGDSAAVAVHYRREEQKSHVIGVASSEMDVVQLARDGDVNESLRLSLIKYFRNSGADTPGKAKAICRSLSSMDDETVSRLFELSLENGQDSAVQPCDSLLGYPGAYNGGTVKDGDVTSFTKGDTTNYNLVLRRYKQVGNNVLGVIYEFETGDVLCHTIENAEKVYDQSMTNLRVGVHPITPGGGTWPSDGPHHLGCSSYTVAKVGGRYGFGSRVGAPNTMLRIGSGGGCLFHPGKDSTWSSGCILVGSQANSTTGRREFNLADYNQDRIQTSTDADVIAYRHFYDKVFENMATRNVNIEIVKNYGEPLTR